MTITRRALLSAGLTLPVLREGAASTRAASVQRAVADSSFDPWVEVNRANLQHNVGEIARRVASRPILAVIKNNGYGIGIVNAGQLLEPLPAIAGLAVVKMHEAIALRDAGVKKPVLLMGPFDERNLGKRIGEHVEVRRLRSGRGCRLAHAVEEPIHARRDIDEVTGPAIDGDPGLGATLGQQPMHVVAQTRDLAALRASPSESDGGEHRSVIAREWA